MTNVFSERGSHETDATRRDVPRADNLDVVVPIDELTSVSGMSSERS